MIEHGFSREFIPQTCRSRYVSALSVTPFLLRIAEGYRLIPAKKTLQVPDFVPPIFGLRNDGRSSVIPRQVHFVRVLESLICSRSSKVFCVWDVAIGCPGWFTVWDPRLFFLCAGTVMVYTRGDGGSVQVPISLIVPPGLSCCQRFHFIGCVPLEDEVSIGRSI